MQSVFSWALKVARKCESKHWHACGADGRSDGRSVYGYVITEFSRMGSLPYFLPMVPLRRASRARAPLKSNSHRYQAAFSTLKLQVSLLRALFDYNSVLLSSW